ncbi:hypothetical protein JAAARDRAFT_37846 [Jaapia argillacea MUCL 33604]|uniref:Uncharacterized protein n=1 Tax=Jaapia argillacea MUCL 33604 TaxID=933084 RepID=A0A067PIV4_9AGAM|nr:hypothetical protein JAAARDRAFT_37846 [Jaapia argillacea MUCL 33604]
MDQDWHRFECEEPDFHVRSVDDDVVFGVQRARLEEGSDVFRDMFSVCEKGGVGDPTQGGVLDLLEPAEVLSILLTLLHFPPKPYIPDPSADVYSTKIVCIPAEKAIPLPLLPRLFTLADKYTLSESLVESLRTHLAAHASTFPLQVYGHSVALGLDALAESTSIYLLHPPLTTYTTEEISVIPTAVAYHKLVLLHFHRVMRLRETLLGEQIFPHGYGKCASHESRTEGLWDSQKKLLVDKIEAGTDVAAEMGAIMSSLPDCKTCQKACTAALEMLAYKCRKVIKRIDQLPS